MALNRSKEERALDGATEVFTRYGYARTTMGDIAIKAGMSRPALYLVFPDKEAAFNRVIAHMDQHKLTEIAAVLATLPNLESKLLHACLAWGLHGVELAAVHPDAADLFDLRFPAVRQVYANFQALVTELISDALTNSRLEATPTDLARVLVYGLRGLREAASDPDDMRRLVTMHVLSFAKAISA
ncbi:TetR/AcrR family transcriptional regulator [Bradyrhizobium cenepequi]|uniref:TetR/AcrR family transcriptional regulator n=1 Tax=Bradyrhizobium cenepequi TaxID=2821403 RepID=UPI001CE3B007|nr:TetR/AcrR family transcriptional regulator [Bradyrhizobium cenepequi]MCA6109115.1 TetR/AcrR family transcriptional regulator [Bradyrhizobium cenepequi]